MIQRLFITALAVLSTLLILTVIADAANMNLVSESRGHDAPHVKVKSASLLSKTPFTPSLPGHVGQVTPPIGTNPVVKPSLPGTLPGAGIITKVPQQNVGDPQQIPLTSVSLGQVVSSSQISPLPGINLPTATRALPGQVTPPMGTNPTQKPALPGASGR